MVSFNRPSQSKYGWHVFDIMSNQYLHTDGELYKASYNNEGKYTGFFKSEVEAYRAMYDYTDTL